MVEILRDLFLSPLLIFAVLALIFLALSYWSVVLLHEYAGYVLGWLIGLFVVVVFASLGAEPDVQAQTVELERATLNIFQVLCSGGIGLIIGVSAIVMRLMRLPVHTPRGVQVGLITALWVTLLFLMFMVGIETQRMIGIFALAFCIARLFGVVLAGGQLPYGLFSLEPAQGTDTGGNPLDMAGGLGAYNAQQSPRSRFPFNRTRR